MRPGRRLGLLLTGALLLAPGAGGCALIESLGGQPAATPGEGYFDILERWTRSAQVYDELDTKLLVSATYKSWAFRQAYVAEYARIYLLPDREREAFLAREREALEEYHDFMVAAYAPIRELADLSVERGIWRLYLEGPQGLRVEPDFTELVREPLAILSAFFPYVDRWSRVLLVRFPRRTAGGEPVVPNPEREPFRLILTSTEARTALTWRP